MSRSMTLSVAFTAGLLALAGCDSRDPYLRTDVWQPTGANAGNIAAMVADPHDLISGRGTDVQNAGEPALAVSHVLARHSRSRCWGPPVRPVRAANPAAGRAAVPAAPVGARADRPAVQGADNA